MENLNQEVKDKLEKVCICRAITKASIKDSVRSGKTTVEDIAGDTGATLGGCKGFRCKARIQEIIDGYQTEWN